MFTSISHIVIAVKDLESAIKQYENIYGLKFSTPGDPGNQGFRGVITHFEDGRAIELVQPTDETGAVGRRVATAGEGIYLVAMRVSNLQETLADLRAKGIRLVNDPGPGNEPRGLVLIHPSQTNGVLTRVMQDPNVTPTP
jgi:methylmalonyl-CoA epimerase